MSSLRTQFQNTRASKITSPGLASLSDACTTNMLCLESSVLSAMACEVSGLPARLRTTGHARLSIKCRRGKENWCDRRTEGSMNSHPGRCRDSAAAGLWHIIETGVMGSDGRLCSLTREFFRIATGNREDQTIARSTWRGSMHCADRHCVSLSVSSPCSLPRRRHDLTDSSELRQLANVERSAGRQARLDG